MNIKEMAVRMAPTLERMTPILDRAQASGRSYLPYTGIGSRETPPLVRGYMCGIAHILASRGWTLRSGGAQGADQAFELGADKKEIFLPWPGFNDSKSPLFVYDQWAYDLAERHHPRFRQLSQGAQKMMVRNSAQVLGVNGDSPSLFVLCWTKDGGFSGGTGQALRIADDYRIPIFNLNWENQ